MRLESVLFFLLLIVMGCTSLVIKPANFAWPIETVLQVDNAGNIKDERYSLTLNVKHLLYAETKDSINVSGVAVRIIRNAEGYYFVTAPKFKNVYVFEQGEASLRLYKKIAVSAKGLDAPALNQRQSYIELVNGEDRPIKLSASGIIESEGE